MKIPTNRLLVASALLAAAGAPDSLSYISRGGIIVIAGALCFCLMLYDRWIRQFCTIDQTKRIDKSNFLSLVLITIPLAVRCAHGTWTNLLFDSIAYAGCVCLIALGGAARFDPLLQMSRFKLHKALPVIFYISCAAYVLIVGIQAISYYNAYSTEWVDFSFGFPPVWQNLHYGFFRMINEFSTEMTLLRT
ncbi:MAG: hypothetical protein WBM07_18575, partial [Chitinivibrionales bacterium]